MAYKKKKLNKNKKTLFLCVNCQPLLVRHSWCLWYNEKMIMDDILYVNEPIYELHTQWKINRHACTLEVPTHRVSWGNHPERSWENPLHSSLSVLSLTAILVPSSSFSLFHPDTEINLFQTISSLVFFSPLPTLFLYCRAIFIFPSERYRRW